MNPFLLLTFLLAVVYSFGQENTDSTGSEQYCLVRIYGLKFNNTVEVSADYGLTKMSGIGRDILKDEMGKRKIFLSAGSW